MKRPFAMNLRHVSVALFVAATLHGAGCTEDPISPDVDADEDRIGSSEQYAGTGGDPGTHNHFRPACFWDHAFQQTARDLGAVSLIAYDDKLPEMPFMAKLLDDTCRQEALEVMIGCALEPGKVVVDEEDGERRYGGELGYATGWVDGPLTKIEKERLTGCMLERLNAFGFVMSILLYSEPDFRPDQEGLDMYPVTESQAWGNLFDSIVALNPTNDPNILTRPAFNAYVCKDPGLYDCSVANVMYTSGRICDNNNASCGLIMMGACDNQCPHGTANECDVWSGRTYARTPDDAFCDPN